MQVFGAGDFHYQVSLSRGEVLPRGFVWWIVPSGGAGSQHQLATISIQTGDRGHVYFGFCRQRSRGLD